MYQQTRTIQVFVKCAIGAGWSRATAEFMNYENHSLDPANASLVGGKSP